MNIRLRSGIKQLFHDYLKGSWLLCISYRCLFTSALPCLLFDTFKNTFKRADRDFVVNVKRWWVQPFHTGCSYVTASLSGEDIQLGATWAGWWQAKPGDRYPSFPTTVASNQKDTYNFQFHCSIFPTLQGCTVVKYICQQPVTITNTFPFINKEKKWIWKENFKLSSIYLHQRCSM